jgi:hypothetical protein
MLYIFLLYHDPSVQPPRDILEQHFTFWREAQARGAYVTSEALGGTENATTVRVRKGRALTSDGPFAETKEVLGGLYILECKDRAEALAYAAKIPDANGGSVEVRPLMHVPGWEYTLPGERQPFGPPE